MGGEAEQGRARRSISAGTISTGSRARWPWSWRPACRPTCRRSKRRGRRACRSMPKWTSDSWRSGVTRCIGITGTNGKTTTTSLIAHVLVAGGLRAETAGNIGRPLCDVARADSPPDWLALELSSFQLHDAPNLRPAVGVLTNLAPNHLDRYHTLEEYYGDKALLFRNADAELRHRQQRRRSGGAGHGSIGAGAASAVLGARAGRRLVRPGDGPAHAGGQLAAPAGRPAASGRPQRGQRADGRAGGHGRRVPGGGDRRRAPNLPGDPPPGGAGARGGGRAVDQRLQVHQRHLDRGRDRGARPALRAPAGRPAQGRAVYPAGGAVCAIAAARWWLTARPGPS